MPLRSYQPEKSGRCPHCKDGFEMYQPANEAALSECPKCGMPVTLVEAQEVNSPIRTRPLSDRELREKGFKVFRKTSGGEYADN